MNDTGRPQFRIREVLSASWKVFTDNFVVLFVAHLLFSLIVSTAASVLPLVGGILLSGPLWYGLAFLALAAVRGAPVRMEDLFLGFQRFAPTMLAGVYMSLFALAGALLLAVPAVFAVLAAWMTGSVIIISMTFSVACVLCLVPACAVVVLYAPAFFLMHDRGLEAWPALQASKAIVTANLRQWLIVWAGLSILHLAGLLLCCVGTYVATPWMIVALAIAYERERAAPPAVPGAR